MRFDLFERMSCEEANAVLAKFLAEEPARLERFREQAKDAGASCDFTIQSVAGFVRYVMESLSTRSIPPDENVPEWIRSTDDYKNSLYEFDERSGDLIVTAAFYVGEAFRRSFDGLEWGTGDTETAFANMPVVQGFENDREFPPILILENLIRRIIEEPEKSGDIEVMVSRWSSMAPEARKR
jgi:hypothetical protein